MSDGEYNSLIAELQVDYLASFPAKITTLKSHFSDQDWQGLELEFHKLKGTGTTYGIPEISDICREMERICRDTPDKISGVFSVCVDLIQDVEKSYKNQKEKFALETDKRYSLLCQQGA